MADRNGLGTTRVVASLEVFRVLRYAYSHGVDLQGLDWNRIVVHLRASAALKVPPIVRLSGLEKELMADNS